MHSFILRSLLGLLLYWGPLALSCIDWKKR